MLPWVNWNQVWSVQSYQTESLVEPKDPGGHLSKEIFSDLEEKYGYDMAKVTLMSTCRWIDVIDQRFSTIVRSTDLFSLELSNKKVRIANTTIAVWCEWIKTVPNFLSDWQKVYFLLCCRILGTVYVCHEMRKVENRCSRSSLEDVPSHFCDSLTFQDHKGILSWGWNL